MVKQSPEGALTNLRTRQTLYIADSLIACSKASMVPKPAPFTVKIGHNIGAAIKTVAAAQQRIFKLSVTV